MFIFHIGYAKSATTFLQNRIFPNLPQVNYIGRSYEETNSQIKKGEWVYDFIFKDSISIPEFAHALLAETNGEMLVDLISHEVLLRSYRRYRSLKRIQALGEYLGEIKIIVSIRKQTDIILSRSVHDRGIIQYETIEDVLDFEGVSECKWPYCDMKRKEYIIRRPKCNCQKTGYKIINVPFYNYLEFYGLLQSLFGQANVHFIVNEALQENLAGELERLTNFFDTKSIMQQLLIDVAGTKDNSQRNQSSYLKAKKEFISSGKYDEVFKYFKYSNKLLAKALQFDLGKYRYY